MIMAFLFMPEAKHENKELESYATMFITKMRASYYMKTDAYQSFREFVESDNDLDFFTTLREYIAIHAHERLLSIQLLKQINSLCDQITAIHLESVTFIKSAVDQIERAKTDDVNYFMNKKM